MAQATDQELVDRFETFLRRYYSDEVGNLARNYPRDQKSLRVDWSDLYQFDADLADDYLRYPDRYQEAAEEALRRYDLPIDVSLGQAHVRVRGIAESTEIRALRSEHLNTFIAIQGIIRKATEVRPKIEQAVFVCQRCNYETQVPQSDSGFQEPYQCESCERQGPFKLDPEKSEFIDAQKLRIQENPEGLAGGETPENIDVHVEDDLTGQVTPGDHVTATGSLRLDQSEGSNESPIFDVYMEGNHVEIEDEQFEDMEITSDDKEEIIGISQRPNIYEDMVDSVAPSIYGHRQAKLAMLLQLFSGVTKHLPDGSRIRGDLHMLLIGDPGTGKCLDGDTRVTLDDGTERPIREIVEENLDDPTPVDDGVWDAVDIPLPSMEADGSLTERRATKVWKREAPEEMYRVRTASGRELDVTPSHPLFVQSGGHVEARRAEDLTEGEFVAVAPRTVTDGGTTAMAAGATVGEKVAFEPIRSIERVEPAEEWVYDLEVEGTHTYLSNGVVSHNSQLLSYVQNIAPRSVYTSGKGSSSAGLCVTGDTLVHTAEGVREIRDIVSERLPEPVDEETAVEDAVELYTFDRDDGAIDTRSTSHLWRMPEKPCRRIETAHGKEIEASVNTPVLTCGKSGIEWKPISEIEAGDHVAAPRYDNIERSELHVRNFLELTEEKVKIDDTSVSFVRDALVERFGTLRDAAAELGISEDFVYDSLRNRHVAPEKLDVVLDAVDATRDDVTYERTMLRHGDSVRIPEVFDDDLMYLVGLVFGDGDIALDRRGDNRGLVRLSNGDESLLERARGIFAEKFDKHVEIERQDERVPCIRVSNATIARLFANVGMRTPKADLALDPQFTTAEHADAFVRGLMDADGAVSQRSNGGSSVLLSTISERLSEQLQAILETYGVRARTRERDRRGTYELANGRTSESKHVQHFVELYGANIERYADVIGFESAAKRVALDRVAGDAARREEMIPVGSALATVNGTSGDYYMNVNRGDNPGRGRARAMLNDLDLGGAEPLVEEAVDADLRWDEVVAAVDTGEKEVFDLTVPETHNFVGNGIVTHNTAAAVRDDFGDGQQWTLEAGALVLADQGIAAVDELDKMAPDDRSAMHEALEQQSISVSKAGINATLKSRCSLLGAANPKYGRFDQYEPIGEQIDLEPALVSRFDLIFTVTDQPDPEEDARLAEHILQTNYAGELHTQREHLASANYTEDEVAAQTNEVAPEIDAQLLRKYIAYARRNVYPAMSDEARAAIEEFYVDLRAEGSDEDAPVPVTARKLEALVRLAEASARVRLSDTVEKQDAERVIAIVRSCLEAIGVDPETGEFDADVVETGTSKSQRDRIKSLRALIEDIEDDFEEGAPTEEVMARAEEVGMERSKAEHEIEKLKKQGEVYEPSNGHLRTT